MKIKVKFPGDHVILDVVDATEFVSVMNAIKCYEKKGYGRDDPYTECKENPTFEILRETQFEVPTPSAAYPEKLETFPTAPRPASMIHPSPAVNLDDQI
jgi:hypothetical protein